MLDIPRARMVGEDASFGERPGLAIGGHQRRDPLLRAGRGFLERDLTDDNNQSGLADW
jgi:hypothetical protein